MTALVSSKRDALALCDKVGGGQLGEERSEVASSRERDTDADVGGRQHQQHRDGDAEPLGLHEPQGGGSKERDAKADDQSDGTQEQVRRGGLAVAALGLEPQCGQFASDDSAEDVPDRSPKNDQ